MNQLLFFKNCAGKESVSSQSDRKGAGGAGETTVTCLLHDESSHLQSTSASPLPPKIPLLWKSCFCVLGTVHRADLLCLSVISDLDADRVCGYGTARCRRTWRTEESRIGRCPNTYPYCLKNGMPSHRTVWNAKTKLEPGPQGR